MEFTREQTSIAKGIAICLMFTNHLYAFKYRLLNGNYYIPFIPFFDAEHFIGNFGSICVSIFLFLSGYGMFLGYLRSKKGSIQYSLVKLKEFYATYWLYFLIFVPIGIFFFKDVTFWQSSELRYSSEPIIFLENFSGWISTYNEEWWFVRMFAITLIFLFPLYTKIAEKNIILVIIVSLLMFSFGLRVNPYQEFGFLFWQTSFALGIVCAKLNFFSSKFIRNLDEVEWIRIFLGLIFCFVLRTVLASGATNYKAAYDFMIVPFFIYFSIRTMAILHLSQLFAYLGQYSFPLWLTHSFFCYYYFQNIIYSPRWSPLIFFLLTIISTLSVLIIEQGHLILNKSLRVLRLKPARR